MKLRATKKQIKDGFNSEYIIKIGYCGADSLLQYHNAFAYNAGVNGWNCDFYELHFNNERYCISTGYNPMGKEVDYKRLRELENEAQKISSDFNISYELKKQQINELLNVLLLSVKK